VYPTQCDSAGKACLRDSVILVEQRVQGRTRESHCSSFMDPPLTTAPLKRRQLPLPIARGPAGSATSTVRRTGVPQRRELAGVGGLPRGRGEPAPSFFGGCPGKNYIEGFIGPTMNLADRNPACRHDAVIQAASPLYQRLQSAYGDKDSRPPGLRLPPAAGDPSLPPRVPDAAPLKPGDSPIAIIPVLRA